MKRQLVIAALSMGLVASVQAAPVAAKAKPNALTSQEDKLSYAIGVDMGKTLKRDNVQINPDVFAQGVKDAVSGKELLMSQEDMQQAIATFQKQFIAQQAAKMKAKAADNAKASEAFLAKNKSEPGVKTLPSGLQYKIITAGKGDSPTANDTVTVEYEGKTINGKVFDSSYKRGEPTTFKVSQVIPGWQEGLQHMKAGGTWMLYIPPKLAYGEQGVGGPIGPNETLIFKIHLISIAKDQGSNTATAKNS